MTESLTRTQSTTVGALNREQVDLLKDTICKGATDSELELFTQVCNRLQLDPFSKQIYAVKRWDSETKSMKMAFQVSITGSGLSLNALVNIADKPRRNGAALTAFGADVWLKNEPPAAARVGVYRAGFEGPVYSPARYGAYVQTKKSGEPTIMWATKSDIMLAKCAESLALHKAFPNELSGVYTDDEMGQADSPTVRVHERKANFKAPVEDLPIDAPKELQAPSISTDDVVAKIEAAQTIDELDATVDLCRKLKGRAVTKARQVFASKKQQLEEVAAMATEEPPFSDDDAKKSGDFGFGG